MRSSFTPPTGLSALALLATAMFLLLAGSSPANAAVRSTGNATFSIGNGKAAKVMKKSKVKVSGVGAAKTGKVGKRVQVKAPVRTLTVRNRSSATLRGGLRIKAGTRKVVVRGLTVKLNDAKTFIKGRIGKKKLIVFRANGKPTVSTEAGTVRLAAAKLSLTRPAAKQVRKTLKLKRLPAAQVGSFSFFGKVTDDTPIDPCVTDPTGAGCPDPYLAQCGVEATSVTTGNLPVAAPLPVLAGAKDVAAGNSVTWGFKSSFRSYIIFGASGSLQAVAPATVQAGMGPVASGFNFPVEGGEYAANNAIDTSDDQAIVPGTGTSLFCATGHGFRIAISNPTVVIDGANSRLVADVDTNLTGVWTPTQRIDIATLDLSDVSPFYNKSGSEVSWSDIPVTMTQAGGDVICGTGEQAACSYTAGTELDPIDVTVKTPYDTSDLTSLANYVETELPFPIQNPTIGGCTLPNPVDGNRTIDAAQAANPAASPVWKTNASAAAAVPDISGATAVTGGRLDWGVRSGLRGTVNATGEFNLSSGVTASNSPYYGTGMGAIPPPAVPGVGQMSGPGKFFTWPANSSGGFYDPTGDGRLVLRTSGRVAFCQTQTAQVYGTVLSNPTVIIDGADSRITVDIATRYRLSWVRGTVDIASLDLAAVTPVSVDDSGTTTVSWALPDSGPVTLTADGEDMLNMLSKNIYVAGALLDGATIRASFPTPG